MTRVQSNFAGTHNLHKSYARVLQTTMPDHTATVSELNPEDKINQETILLITEVKNAAEYGYARTYELDLGRVKKNVKEAWCKPVTDRIVDYFKDCSSIKVLCKIERMNYVGILPYPLHYFAKIDFNGEGWLIDATYKQYLEHLPEATKSTMPDVMAIKLTDSNKLIKSLKEHNVPEKAYIIWLSKLFPDEYSNHPQDSVVLRLARRLK